MVVWKAIVTYPDSEVRGQQAVPQSQITAGGFEKSDKTEKKTILSYGCEDWGSCMKNEPVDVVVLMEVQQTRGDLKSHPLKSQKVSGWQVRCHPVWLPLGSQVPLQVTLIVNNINSLSEAQILLGLQLFICQSH